MRKFVCHNCENKGDEGVCTLSVEETLNAPIWCPFPVTGRPPDPANWEEEE